MKNQIQLTKTYQNLRPLNSRSILHPRSNSRPLATLTFLLFAAASVFGGSATWNLSPVSTDWNTAENWMPATVPNGPTDTATFDVSRRIDVEFSANTEINGIVFSAGASAFTIVANGNAVTSLTISGVGITNNSGTPQNFVIK